jgi:hypothetical protein
MSRKYMLLRSTASTFLPCNTPTLLIRDVTPDQTRFKQHGK